MTVGELADFLFHACTSSSESEDLFEWSLEQWRAKKTGATTKSKAEDGDLILKK